jgi:8-oxo-dGTP pyrophosphatase MutT (NUDIX family)
MPHIHDKMDFTSEVFIIYKNKVLLRKHDKIKIWLSVGGHIEHDEDPSEAAIREVKEEVGLDVELFQEEDHSFLNSEDSRQVIKPLFVSRHRITPTHEHVTFIFFAKANTDKLKLSDSEISEDIRWFSKEDLDTEKSLRKDIKFYALKALEKLAN